MRHRGRTDGTQTEIVKALRKLGATVAVTSALGDGFPDLVVGWRGVNHLVEVKNGSLSPSKRELTPDEEKFHATWRGAPVVTLESADGSIEWILRLNERRVDP